MTNSEDQYPPDDYVIGESYPPPPPGTEPEASSAVPGLIGSSPEDRWGRNAPAGLVGDEDYEDDGEYYEDDEYYEDQAIGDPYYYDDDVPARQPAFYIFIAVAVVLGGLFVFLLFNLFRNDNDGAPAIVDDDPAFHIRIDNPQDNDLIQVDEDVEVIIQANSNEQIVSIDLLVGGEVRDSARFTDVPADGVYAPTLILNFEETGNYDLVARATSESGATKESDPVRVRVVTELVDEQPASITGEVISTVNARIGPGEEFPTERTYDAGDRVVLVGRSAGESEWVLLDSGLWIRRAAVRLDDSLALLPVRRPTPTPAPSSTPTPQPSETATPEGGLPDLSPSNAALADEGATLRVTIRNQSTADYQGPLVVSAVGLPEGDLQEAFLVNIPAGGNQVVEFDLPRANTDGGTVQISVDVGNNVEESNEDNNDATFLLSPSVDPPVFTVAATVNGATIDVTVTNVGGPLTDASMFVSVSLADSTNSSGTADSLSLQTGQSRSFKVSTPIGTGQATVTVFVNGEAFGSGSVQIGDPATATPEPTTEN